MFCKSTKRNLRLLPAIFAALAFSFSVTSCSKDDGDDDNDKTDEPKPNLVSAEIDGIPHEWPISNIAGSGGERQIHTVSSTDPTSIQIYFPEDTTGTFALSDTSVVTVSYTDGNTYWSDNLSGTLTLDMNTSEEISGSFSAVLASAFSNTDTITMTEGSFYWNF